MSGQHEQRTPLLSSTRWVTIGAMVLGLLVAGLASSQPRGAHRMGPHEQGARLEHMAKVLELSDSQEAEIKVIFEAHHDSASSQREEVKANAEALKAALDAPNPDASAVGRLVIKGHQLREQSRSERETHEANIANVLTEQQLAKWEGFKAGRDRDGRRGDRAGARKGPRAGFGRN